MSEFKMGMKAKVKFNGAIGLVTMVDELLNHIELKFGDDSFAVYRGYDLEPYEEEQEEVMFADDLKTSGFEELGLKIGKLVDKKQRAYGDSVTKAYKLMQVYLESYDNGNGTYTIPKSLLKHILLQVRIIDKQNRIFNNPNGDLMDENPYSDTVGYGLLGMRMVETNE